MNKDANIWTKDMLRGAAWTMQNIAIPLTEERDAYRNALRELLLGGSHEGECDNGDDGECGACSLHIEASKRRHAIAQEALDKYDRA